MTIKIFNLSKADRVQPEELLSAVSDSVARAVKARGDIIIDSVVIAGRIPIEPVLTGAMYPFPPKIIIG